jgi:CheY-like chemotaxis protein
LKGINPLESILIVDDSSFTRNRLRETLVKRGYGVDEARNGVEALAKLEGRLLLPVDRPAIAGNGWLRVAREPAKAGLTDSGYRFVIGHPEDFAREMPSARRQSLSEQAAQRR